MSRNYFLIYTTASDESFISDINNFRNMIKYDSGVGLITVCIVISEVVAIDVKRERRLSILRNVIKQSAGFSLLEVVLKGNIGRDFSSAKVGLDCISPWVAANDYIMIRNRSALGPLMHSWFKKFVDHFESEQKMGLVGNTINLTQHPEVSPGACVPHVQTYVYLSQFKILDSIKTDFPGIYEEDRIQLIANGEIGLSGCLMEQGYLISSLHWPHVRIGDKTGIDDKLPKRDIKKESFGLPFVHRKAMSRNYHRFQKLKGGLYVFFYSLRFFQLGKPVLKRLNAFYEKP